MGSVLEDEPITVHYSIANIGVTQGTIRRSALYIEIVAQGAPRLLAMSTMLLQNEIGPFSLAPGEAMEFKFEKPTPPWKADRFKIKSFPVVSQSGVVERRDATIHFVGQIIYVDDAGTHRRTAFRRELIPERQRFYRIPDEPDLDYSD